MPVVKLTKVKFVFMTLNRLPPQLLSFIPNKKGNACVGKIKYGFETVSRAAASDTWGMGSNPIISILRPFIQCLKAKPQISLTAPNCNHFARISLTVLDFFGRNCQSLKTHSQIYSTESRARFADKEVIQLWQWWLIYSYLT